MVTSREVFGQLYEASPPTQKSLQALPNTVAKGAMPLVTLQLAENDPPALRGIIPRALSARVCVWAGARDGRALAPHGVARALPPRLGLRVLREVDDRRAGDLHITILCC